jgi:EAL domain-containing protein (putative c-di-GMP-specific phosphodiesterase class I)
MVKKLGFETIAEGVETEEQFRYLHDIDCDNIQGFYLGKPMPSEKIADLLANITA